MWKALISILILGAARPADADCRIQDYPIVLKLSDCTDYYYDTFAPRANSRIEFVLVGKPSEISEKELLWAVHVNQWEPPAFKTKLLFDADYSNFLLDFHDSHTGNNRQIHLENLYIEKPNEPFNLFIQIFQSKVAYGEAEQYEEGGLKKFKVTKSPHRLSDHKLHGLYQEVFYETAKQYVIGIRADSSVAYELHFLPQFWTNRTAVQDIAIPKIIPHDRVEQEKDQACVWCFIGFVLALLVGIFLGATVVFVAFFFIYKKKVAALKGRRRRSAKSANKLSSKKESDGTPAGSRSKTGSASDTNREKKSKTEKSSKKSNKAKDGIKKSKKD